MKFIFYISLIGNNELLVDCFFNVINIVFMLRTFTFVILTATTSVILPDRVFDSHTIRKLPFLIF